LAVLESEFVEVLMFRRKERGVSFLLLKRAPTESPYPGIWQVVSGKRTSGENAVSAALREIREETGCTPEHMWVLPFVNTFYAPAGDAVHMVPAFAAEVASDAEVVLSDEHTESRWVSRKTASALVQWPSHLTMMDLVEQYILHERGSVHQVILP